MTVIKRLLTLSDSETTRQAERLRDREKESLRVREEERWRDRVIERQGDWIQTELNVIKIDPRDWPLFTSSHEEKRKSVRVRSEL